MLCASVAHDMDHEARLSHTRTETLGAVENAATAIPSIAHGAFMQLMGASSAGFMYSDSGGGGPPVVFLHGC